MLSASMLRDLERGTVTEADLLHRQSELAVNSPSLLRIAYLHLKTLRSQASERRNPFGGRLIEGGKIAKA